jgi:prepilin-type N-terminal cleavage/methylation domain-containing protein
MFHPHRMHRQLSSRRGFTMVEMMIGLALAGVAATVLFSLFVSTQGMYYDTRNQMEAQADTRVVLGMMSQEIRSCGSDVTTIPLERMVVCAGDTLRVQSDLDSDGVLEGAVEPSEDVTWYYNASNESLVRSTAAGQMEVMTNVSFFGLNFLDAQGNELGPLPLDGANRRLVRAVEIFMTVDVEDGVQRNWNTTIALRNDATLN